MSTTAYNYRKIKDLERTCDHQGFEIRIDSQFGSERLSLAPKSDRLPVYSRTATLYTGDAEYLESFLSGWYAAKQYLKMLGVVDDKKLERKEQDYRNKLLADMIKHGKKVDERT